MRLAVLASCAVGGRNAAFMGLTRHAGALRPLSAMRRINPMGNVLRCNVTVRALSMAVTKTEMPQPPNYPRPELPPNVVIEDESVLSDEEDKRLNFEYVVNFGPKKAPFFRFTEEKKLKSAGEYRLRDRIFNTPVRKDIIHRVVVWQRANRRKGLAKVKSVGEVRGSGKKPHAQKGQGRARQGSRFAPHMRGGGRAFKKRTDWSQSLPKKVRRFGLRALLSARFIEGQLFVVDSFTPGLGSPATPQAEGPSRVLPPVAEDEGNDDDDELNEEAAAADSDDEQEEDEDDENYEEEEFLKTRDVSALVNEMEWDTVCFVDKWDFTPEFRRAQENLSYTQFYKSRRANVYDLLKFKTLVFSRDGLEEICDRLDEKKQRDHKMAKRRLL